MFLQKIYDIFLKNIASRRQLCYNHIAHFRMSGYAGMSCDEASGSTHDHKHSNDVHIALPGRRNDMRFCMHHAFAEKSFKHAWIITEKEYQI